MKDKHKGSVAEMRAALWLLDQGYEVFINASRHGTLDMVAWMEETGEVILIDATSCVPTAATKLRDKPDGVKVLLVLESECRFYDGPPAGRYCGKKGHRRWLNGKSVAP